MKKIMALLERVRSFEAETLMELEHIARLRRIAQSTRKNVYTSREYSEEIVEKLAALERESNALIDRTFDAKRRAMEYISFLEGDERAVIEGYYILAMDWSDIAQKLLMSERRVYLLRKSGLKRIEERFCAGGENKGDTA